MPLDFGNDLLGNQNLALLVMPRRFARKGMPERMPRLDQWVTNFANLANELLHLVARGIGPLSV